VDFTANLIAEQLLHPGQIGGNQRANFVAMGEEEVECYHLVLHQVIVEKHPLALMGDQGNVRQVLLLDAPSGLFRQTQLRGSKRSFAAGNITENSHRRRRGCRIAKELPS